MGTWNKKVGWRARDKRRGNFTRGDPRTCGNRAAVAEYVILRSHPSRSNADKDRSTGGSTGGSTGRDAMGQLVEKRERLTR